MKAQTKSLVTAKMSTTIPDAMRLMIENRISCLLITEGEGRLKGIISDKDIFKACRDYCHEFANKTIADLATTDVIVGVDNDDLNYIAHLMTQNRIRHIPIVDGEQLVGLVSIGDVVKAQMDDIRVENRYLKQYIDGTYPG
ncbi:MAG: CBS domain-containing protein [Candidatus Zixiibacteriota bacterium]